MKYLSKVNTLLIVLITLLLMLIISIKSDSLINPKILAGDYISGVVTELIGLVITVLIINVIFNANQENIKRKEREEKVKRINKVLTAHIKIHIIKINELLTPTLELIKKRKNIQVLWYDTDFEFQKLAYVFDQAPSASNRFYDPSFKSYFSSQKKLHGSIENILLNVDLLDLPELAELFTNYLNTSYMLRIENAVTEDYEMIYTSGKKSGEKTFHSLKKQIENHKGEFDYKKGGPLIKYYAWYELLRYEIKVIKHYSNIVSEKLDENSLSELIPIE